MSCLSLATRAVDVIASATAESSADGASNQQASRRLRFSRPPGKDILRIYLLVNTRTSEEIHEAMFPCVIQIILMSALDIFEMILVKP
jgi:hypothetical protein